MAVYVDKSAKKYKHMIMCHMLADTPQELHDMADNIGLPIDHFQNKDIPHYDLSCSMRNKALKHGAKEVDRHELGKVIKSLRSKGDNR